MTKMALVLVLVLVLSACQPFSVDSGPDVTISGDPDTNTMTISVSEALSHLDFRWMGNWTWYENYDRNDVVNYEGTLWIDVCDHAGGGAPPGNSTCWDMVHSGNTTADCGNCTGGDGIGIQTIIADSGNVTGEDTIYIVGGDCISTSITGNITTITDTCGTNWVISGSVEDGIYIALGWFNDENTSAAD